MRYVAIRDEVQVFTDGWFKLIDRDWWLQQGQESLVIPKVISNEELLDLFQEYLKTCDDEREKESYETERNAAEFALDGFKQFLIEKDKL